MEKICFKCNKKKALDMFYKHSQMLDGHLNKCKDCAKKDTKENYKKNFDYYKFYDKKRDQKPHRKLARQLYAEKNKGKNKEKKREYIRKYRIDNPEKHKAHCIVRKFILNKKLIKQPCVICGEIEVHAHHEDYSKPLDVKWLCSKHHAAVHWGD